jgi:hypothetical protein
MSEQNTTDYDMTRRERLRRVALLSCSFARNFAYYRVGHDEYEGSPLLSPSHPHASFWRQANANFLDMCVLEWCKLFGDRRGEHYWGRIVSDAAVFEAALLSGLRIEQGVFQEQINAMRLYRNKFVAHLDSDATMHIPMLETAKSSVWFFHRHIIEHEAEAGDLAGLPDTVEKLDLGYRQCIAEARKIYRHALAQNG